MVASIGNCSSMAPVQAPSTQAAASIKSPSAAAAQLVQDTVNISQQAQAAASKLDSDGDHDGR